MTDLARLANAQLALEPLTGDEMQRLGFEFKYRACLKRRKAHPNKVAKFCLHG